MKDKVFTWNSLVGRMLIALLLGLISLAGFYAFGGPAAGSPASSGQVIFERECQSCHTIGGGAQVGPDLKGVLEKRDREWVARFITSPDWVIAEGDPIALGLLEEFNGVEMPNGALTEEDVEFILIFLDLQDSLTQAAVVLPSGDPSQGKYLFIGNQPLENGGLPCMGCHSAGNIVKYGGGNLGPDLTHVFDRYGEPGLVSTMQNISFPTMKHVYAGKSLTQQETADLLAFFTEVDSAGIEGQADTVTGMFWSSGILGTLVLFAFMAIFWPRQSKNQIERLRKSADTDSRK